MLVLIAAISDPAMNTMIEERNIAPWPKRSDRRPTSGITIVEVNRYTVTTHGSWSSPPSSTTMVGRASRRASG